MDLVGGIYHTGLKVIVPRLYVGKLSGEINLLKNGVWRPKRPNTVTTDFKQDTAGGCAAGTFNIIDSVEVNLVAGGPYFVTPTKIAGGDGTVDYVTYEIEWTNPTGGSLTIDSLDMGYDLAAVNGGPIDYVQSGAGLADVVGAGLTIKYQWTITFSLSSGGMTATYRKEMIKMVYAGTFTIPNKINFIDTMAADNCVVAALDSGGTGAEDYHTWSATHTNPGPAVQTIDIIKCGAGAVCPFATEYSTDDIVNKALAAAETLEAFCKFQHI